MTPRHALGLLIAVSAALRVIWAGSIGLGHDEAYHFLFAAHPSLSYFDHPPMLAVVESAGAILLGSASPVALRIGFIALFAGSTFLLARLTARFFGAWAGVFAAFAMNVSAYHTAAAGSFALPDGPLLFFWLLTLDRMVPALDDPKRVVPWLGVGLAWGGALLSKYHAVFLPLGLLVYLAWTPAARKVLRMPGPYLASAVGVACFVPVLYWNATHGWASFVFQGSRAVARTGFKPLSLLASIGGQAAYLFPWIWVALLVVMVAAMRRQVRGEGSEAERFLLSQSVTPLVLFSAVASVKDVLPHWTLIGYVSAYPLLGRYWAERSAGRLALDRRRIAVLAALPVVVATVMVAQYRVGLIPLERFTGRALDVDKLDPTAQLYGWDQVAAELKRLGLLDDPGAFLFTGSWYNSGHLGHAVRESGVPVVCYHPSDARSFAFWSRPEEWVGRDGILVTLNGRPADADSYARWFERIEPAGEFTIVRAGKPVRIARFYRCVKQVAPFPYDYNGPTRTGKRDEPGPLMAGGRDWR